MMAKKKPEGWRNRKPDDPHRHALSAKGIPNAPSKSDAIRLATMEFLRQEELEKPWLLKAEKEYDEDYIGIRDAPTVIPKPVQNPPSEFALDFGEMHTADDGTTAYYSGSIAVNGIPIEIKGTDRDTSLAVEIGREIERQLGRRLTDDEHDELDEVTNEARHDPSEAHLPRKVTWEPEE